MDQVLKLNEQRKSKDGPKGRRRKRCISSGLHTGLNGDENDSNTASLMAVIFTLLLFVWSQLKSSKSSTAVAVYMFVRWTGSFCSGFWISLLNIITPPVNCIFIIHFMVIKVNSNSWNVYSSVCTTAKISRVGNVSYRLVRTKYNEVWPHEKQPSCPHCLHRCPRSVGVGCFASLRVKMLPVYHLRGEII